MSLLTIHNITTGYRNTEIIHGISMHIDSEEIVTIIGPNGSGKSTLLKAIMGYLRIFKGEIIFDKNPITNLRTVQRTKLGISYVPQLRNIFPSLTVQENIEMGAYRLGKNELRDGLEKSYQTFPILGERNNMVAGSMSGGQRQMLAMAIALVVRPKLILLDEPSAGLSPKMSVEIFDKINEIAGNGTSMIIVEQDAELSLDISHRGYVLAMGKTVFEDRADAILKHEKIREAYLGG